MLRVSLAAGPVMGRLTCLPFGPDKSRAGLRGPQSIECLLGEPIDHVMRTSGECAATAVRIVGVLDLVRLARGSRGKAADTNFGRKAETRTREIARTRLNTPSPNTRKSRAQIQLKSKPKKLVNRTTWLRFGFCREYKKT